MTRSRGSFGLALGAIGVVYGDIGTSPLYTIKEAFSPHYGLSASEADIFGLLSLITWSLVIVVTVKYVALVMRADNRGEGGIMALTALAQRAAAGRPRLAYALGVLGIFGVALFAGDAVITPAISVLGAVEGVEVAAPALEAWIVPLSVGILVALGVAQSRGTERLGRLMGPVTAAWFIVIAAWGVNGIATGPGVLQSLSPTWALAFATSHGTHTFIVLGAVVLAVTGAEALYADMGHFGASPIRRAWLWFVFPALLLNYFGQGALLLQRPDAVSNPFYELAPRWALYPTIAIATAAAVFASQAVISGAFSLARQAMQLGYLPRLVVHHTSADTIGQIYVPAVNRLVLGASIGVVVAFGSSTALASAYGVSVTGTMTITSLLLLAVASRRWRWPAALLAAVFAPLLAVDLAFFGSNVVKIADGAWFPLALGIVVFTLMRTWRRGRQLLVEEIRRETPPLDGFANDPQLVRHPRVAGVAVFMTATNDHVPFALLNNLRHNKVLHAVNVFVTVRTEDEPWVEESARLSVESVAPGFHRVLLRFGFMEQPDVPKALASLCLDDEVVAGPGTTWFASRETIVASDHKGMPQWRDRLFAIMSRNTVGATTFYRVPGNRLVELGTQVQI